jgi:hypothetical protein
MVHFTGKHIVLWWLSEVRLYHILSQMNPAFSHLLFLQGKFCIVRQKNPKLHEFFFSFFYVMPRPHDLPYHHPNIMFQVSVRDATLVT